MDGILEDAGVRFDGMKTWLYRRVLVAEACDRPQGGFNYPDGLVSLDKTPCTSFSATIATGRSMSK